MHCATILTCPTTVGTFSSKGRTGIYEESPLTRSSSGAQPEHMTYTTKHLIQSFVIVPLLATSLSMNAVTTSITEAVQKATAAQTTISPEEQKLQEEREVRAAKINAYYAKFDLPLAGHGMTMVLAAEKNGLDWRLLPAIAMRESTGGKFICHNSFNAYGWGSCKIHFDSFEEGTNTVAAHLGGNMERTARYYGNKTIEQKLKAYNSVIPAYTKEIFSIMSKIENTEI